MWVNPYMTLVAAYERLIGGRGTEIKPGEPAPPVPVKLPVILHPDAATAKPPRRRRRQRRNRRPRCGKPPPKRAKPHRRRHVRRIRHRRRHEAEN